MKILLSSLALLLCTTGCRLLNQGASVGGEGAVFGLRYTGLFTKNGPIYQRLAINDAALNKLATTQTTSNVVQTTTAMQTRVISIDMEKETNFHLAIQKLCDQQLEQGFKLASTFILNIVPLQITVPPGPRLYLIFQPVTL